MNTITAAFAYIQFIVHLLTFLLVHQVAQWVKLHNIHIEEQSKKKKKNMKEALVGISSWVLPVLKQAVWVNFSNFKKSTIQQR